MNFLAHLYLSDPTPQIMAGNLLADFIKGRVIEELPPDVQRGVRFHRRVDSYTDSHAAVHESILFFGKDSRRFAGIVVDVVYDHYLARNWSKYSSVDFRRWVDSTHEKLLSVEETLPEPLHRPLRGIIRDDRLYSYRQREGIERAIERISDRLSRGKRTIRLEGMLQRLDEQGDILMESHFHRFFEDIRKEADTWRR